MDAASRLPLGDTLDVRPAREFRAGHFASAVSCPLASLPASLHLLPPRTAVLWVFGEDREVAAALAVLRERGYERAEPHPATAGSAAPARPVGSPWVSGEARARLWQPTLLLAEVLADPHAPRPPGLALDLACGSGRDACYLALAGFTVVALDVLPDALARARGLADDAARAAEAHAVACALGRHPWPGGNRGTPAAALAPPLAGPHWVRADAEKGWPFPPGVFDLVACSRFLWRPLFPALAGALRNGGTLLYQTFTREQARHGKPLREEFLLAPGELRRGFESRGLRVVRYREDDPEGGPALASLWAVREGP